MGRDDFERLYALHSRGVYRRALRLLGDKDAAADATQEVFERVLGTRCAIPEEPTATAWFCRVTTNLCLNRLRDRDRQKALLAAKYATGAVTQALGENRTVVGDLLNRIPEELHDVAICFFVDELTYDEIVPLLGVSRRTVSNRLSAFRSLVAQLFPEARSSEP